MKRYLKTPFFIEITQFISRIKSLNLEWFKCNLAWRQPVKK